MSAPIPAHSSSNDTEGMLTDAAVTKVRMAKNISMASVNRNSINGQPILIDRLKAQTEDVGQCLALQGLCASQAAKVSGIVTDRIGATHTVSLFDFEVDLLVGHWFGLTCV